MKKLFTTAIIGLLGICSYAQSLYPDFSSMNFGCDGNSITAGNQWSKTVVYQLGFATHHNVAVRSATWSAYTDPQAYNSDTFAGISGGWQPPDVPFEFQMLPNK